MSGAPYSAENTVVFFVLIKVISTIKSTEAYIDMKEVTS